MRMVLAAASLALAGCGDSGSADADADAAAPANAPAAAVAAPAGANWAETVTETPAGGFVVGNPNAPVKLVEYGSLTCHVCADFSKEGAAKLRDEYVATGRISWEFRHFVRDPLDMALGLLARCQGPQPYFKLSEQAFANQTAFFDKIQGTSPAEQQQIAAMPIERRYAEYARLAGADQFFRVRGVPAARAATCLADQAAVDKLVAITQDGQSKQIPGTPTFFLNGEQQTETSWAGLEPRLKAAIGR